MVHPDYLLAAAGADVAGVYGDRRRAREAKTFRYQQGVLTSKHTLVQVKDHAPYTSAQEMSVYLDPTARAAFDPAEVRLCIALLWPDMSARGRSRSHRLHHPEPCTLRLHAEL